MRAMVLAAQAAVEASPLSPIDRPGPGAARFGIGDRVGIAWLRSTCGRCRFCLSGRENLCADSTYTGWTHDGGYAEYACVPEAFAYAIPPVFDDAEAAPLLCAGIIGYRALQRSRVPRGGRLGLYGFGSSAHITLQVARHWGCAVYVATREPARQRLALNLGAAWAGAPGDPLPDKLDAAIVFAPVGGLVPVALRDLDKGGTAALASIHMTDLPAMSYEPHLFWEKTLQSVTANTRADCEALRAEPAATPPPPPRDSLRACRRQPRAGRHQVVGGGSDGRPDDRLRPHGAAGASRPSRRDGHRRCRGGRARRPRARCARSP